MNLITLADMRTYLKPHVNGGTCDVSMIDDAVAEIEERLQHEGDWRLSHRRVRVLVRNLEFSLPANVTKVCAALVDGQAAALGSQALEFSSAYAGDFEYTTQTARNVVDNGEHPTQYDIPVQRVSDTAWSAGLRLLAFSTHVDDTTGFVTVRGYGENNNEIFSDQDGVHTPGERIAVNRWHLGVEGQVHSFAAQAVSVNKFRSVSRVYKAATKAPVSLYAYDSATQALYFLSKMEPAVTIPSYRRYRLTGVAAPYVDADKSIVKDCASALLFVKLGWVRAAYATDVLYVQNRAAFKFGAKALAAENAGEYDGALASWALAKKELVTEKQDREGDVQIPTVWDIGEGARLSDCNHGYLV